VTTTCQLVSVSTAAATISCVSLCLETARSDLAALSACLYDGLRPVTQT
jgi:hypothetical protein